MPLRRALSAAMLVVLLQPASRSPQPLDSIVNIAFVPDIRVFTTMAAINMAGFNLESPGYTMHPLRVELRRRLAAMPEDLKSRLKRFYQARRVELDEQAQHTKYLSFALAVGPPPQFEPSMKAAELPREVADLLGFEALLVDFYHRAGVQTIWPEYRAAYLREMESYKPLLRRTVLEALSYMRTPARLVLDRQIIFIPDLLGPFNVTNARIVGGSYYLIIGPAGRPEDNQMGLRHEYLHFIIDPLVEKYAAQIMKKQSLLKVVGQQPALQKQFRNDLTLVFAESLINAVSFRIAGLEPQQVERRLVEHYSQGLILEPALYDLLSRFEGQTASLPEWFEILVSSIDLKFEEQERPRLMASLKEGLPTTARPPAQPPDRSLNDKVSQASALMEQRNWDKAEELLRSVIEADAGHAGAWFGLGQVATKKGELQAALLAYRKVLDLPGVDPRRRAWAHVWAGVVLANLERFDEARVEFEKALAIEGDVAGAREEARRKLEELKGNREIGDLGLGIDTFL